MIQRLGVIGNFFGKSSTAKTVAVAKQAAKSANKTIVKTDLATGATFMERNFGDKLYKTEINILADGSKKYTTHVYESNGAAIGKGGSEGLHTFRETVVKRTPNGNVLGGDKVEISKKWSDTMATTGHYENVTKYYDTKGIMHRLEGTRKYNAWRSQQTAVADRTFVELPIPHSSKLLFDTKAAAHANYKHKISGYESASSKHWGYNNHNKFETEGTTYSKAIEAKQAAEAAAVAEREAAILAAKKEAEALKAIQPRVNTGKVFNKNISEFKCIEETRADGAIVRRYFDPLQSTSGKSNPMITTIDKGNYHEELIFDPIKNVKISYKQLGKEEPIIEMRKGLQYRYTSKIEPHPDYGTDKMVRIDKQVYDDGLNHVEFMYGRPEGFKLEAKNPTVSGYINTPEYTPYKGFYSCNWPGAQKQLDNITKDAKLNEVNLMDLFKEYQP